MNRDTLYRRAEAVRALRTELDPAHDALVDAIWEAADEGWQQVEIVKVTGLTRERVRQICDEKYRKRAMERRAKRAPTASS